MDLFSQHRLVFSAFHTNWSDELTLQADRSSKATLNNELAYHSCMPLYNSAEDTYGNFSLKNMKDTGVFIIQKKNTTLHLFFTDDDRQHVVLQRVVNDGGDGDEGAAQDLSGLLFRSIKADMASDVALCLCLIDVKVSKFSTLSTSNSEAAGVDVSASRTCESQQQSDDLGRLSRSFCDFSAKFPHALEDVVCSATSLEMLGFPIESEDSRFLSTASWNDEANENTLLACCEELEDGEEPEDTEAMLLSTFPQLAKFGKKLSICALDCEMCCTAAGTELTRICVLCPINGIVLDTLVSETID
jgi:hypothetical protein